MSWVVVGTGRPKVTAARRLGIGPAALNLAPASHQIEVARFTRQRDHLVNIDYTFKLSHKSASF
jgi:hypothetical protein